MIVVGRQGGGWRVDGRVGETPGSGEFVAVREVVADVDARGQVEHQVVKSRMLEDLSFR